MRTSTLQFIKTVVGAILILGGFSIFVAITTKLLS